MPGPDQVFGGEVLSGRSLRAAAHFIRTAGGRAKSPRLLKSKTMNKLTIKDLDLRGKRVFLRVDFNVPLKDGVVTDDTRIRETLPTLKLALEKGGRLVLASHLGRPKGGPDPKYSLPPG